MALRDRRARRRPARRLIPALLAAFLLAACTVPEHMRVRSGVDPRSQDDDVRFRATYYFRVFDVCRDPTGKVASSPPLLDSLYRFRMTGKANALFSQVRFESGILHKTEIDPFGSSVVFDSKLGRHRFVSQEETDAAVRRNDQYAEIARQISLLKRLDEFLDAEVQERRDDETATRVFQKIMKKVGDVTGRGLIRDDSNSTSNGCPEGTEHRRGFQILGPEGVATFNQDQRLVMAMTSSGKPLIGVLKELSGRVLAEHGSEGDFLLPLVQENLATLQAERVLDRLENDSDVSLEQMVDRIIDAFDRDVTR